MSSNGNATGEGRYHRELQLYHLLKVGCNNRLWWKSWGDPNHASLSDETEACTVPDILSLSESLGDPRQLVTKYSDPEVFREFYQVGSFLSKYPFDVPGIDRVASALEKLEETEQACDETNARLYENDAKASFRRERATLQRVKSVVRRILGESPFPEALDFMGFGPGASVTLPRRKGDAYYKFGNPTPSFTENLTSSLAVIKEWSPLWASYLEGHARPKVVEGNKVTTVRKSYKIDRCIAIEPDLNQVVQRGIGGVIRKRLRAYGLNLNSQEKNQDLAFIGSLNQTYDTLDLSSASDTLCSELVRYLLPDIWSIWTDSCRSMRGRLPTGDVNWWSKYSSMGNGYTFELESLIFYALVIVCLADHGYDRTHCAVYGDDIIVPPECTDQVVHMLEFMGFSLNREKSYRAGQPFRESCGRHWMAGHDVTPIYLRNELNRPQTLVSLHNRSILRGMVNYDMEFRCPFWDDFARKVKSFAPAWLRVAAVPWNDGDTGFWTSFDEARPSRASSFKGHSGLEGWVVRRISARAVNSTVGEGYPALCKSLHLLEGKVDFREVVRAESGSSSDVPYKDSNLRYSISKGIVSKWCDLPPIFYPNG